MVIDKDTNENIDTYELFNCSSVLSQIDTQNAQYIESPEIINKKSEIIEFEADLDLDK